MHVELRRTLGFGVACAAIPLAWLAATAAVAQSPVIRLVPPKVTVAASPAAPGDPAFDASKAAFEALSEADRKAVQDALVWTAGYKGVIDGSFGRGTRDALIVFETREKLNTDAVVDAGELARLTAAAKKAKDGVRFTLVSDPVTGMRLGLPLRLLGKRSANPGGTRFASPDNGFSVETQVMPEGDFDLAKLYDRLKVDRPDRKVTYKATKGNWFVVSGEASDKRFYTRFAEGQGANGSELRGYTLTYPAAAAADFDRITIAIANSFDPFPGPGAVADKAPDKPASGPAVPPAPVPPPRIAAAQLTATGVIVAPGRIVSVLPEACVDPTVRKQKLKVAASDAASGLTLFELAGAKAADLAMSGADLDNGAAVVVVGYSAGKGAPGLGVAAGDAVVHPAAGDKPAQLRVLAPLQQYAGGSAVFDRSGSLRALIGRDAQAPRMVAGIVPQASHAAIAVPEVVRFLAAAGVTLVPVAASGTRTAGEIAAAAGGDLVAIDCAR